MTKKFRKFTKFLLKCSKINKNKYLILLHTSQHINRDRYKILLPKNKYTKDLHQNLW